MSDPIDSTLQELTALAPLLSSRVPPEAEAVHLSPQARAFKEALLTTRVLLGKLQIVKMYWAPNPRCSNCDGD
jgi:hypothetical protein